jgi:hypothetical protein
MYPLKTTREFKNEISDKAMLSLEADRRAKLGFLADKHHGHFSVILRCAKCLRRRPAS